MGIKNIFFSLVISLFLMGPNLLGMQRLQNLYNQLGAQSQTSQEIPPLTAENVKKYPEFGQKYIEEVQSNFLKYAASTEYEKIRATLQLILNTFQAANLLFPIAVKYIDVANHSVLAAIIKKMDDPEKFIQYLGKINEYTAIHLLIDRISNRYYFAFNFPDNKARDSILDSYLKPLAFKILDMPNMLEDFLEDLKSYEFEINNDKIEKSLGDKLRLKSLILTYKEILDVIKINVLSKLDKIPIQTLDLLYY